MNRFPLRLALFGAVSVVAFAFGFLAHSVTEAKELIRVFGYHVIAGTSLWWVLALGGRWADARGWLRDFKGRDRRETMGAIAGLTVVAFAVFPYSYKVLYDELVLQATAWNMHYFREVGTVVRGYEIEGVFSSLYVYLDKRPYFFPFVLSLFHDVTGYRETNAFILNTLLYPAVLGLFYVMARRIAGHRSSLAGLVCVGASSLLAQNANGAGMELLNVAMLLLTMLVAADYLARPDERRLTVLILTTILLAQTRYESSFYVLPAALAVLEGWRRAGRVILPAAALLAPVLLIPRGLHNTYLSGTPLLWELRPDESVRFGLVYLGRNLDHAWTYLFHFSERLLNSWWLSLAGFPAIAWVAWIALRRWRQALAAPAAYQAAVLFGAASAGNLVLLMFYYWGELDDPIVSRLVLPFNLALGLAIAWAVSEINARNPRIKLAGVLIGGAALSYLGCGLTAVAHHATINQLGDEMAWEGREVARMPVKNRLIITNKSVLAWIMRRIPAIGADRTRGPSGLVVSELIQENLENGTFQEVLVTQLLRPTGADGNFVVDVDDQVSPLLVLEPVVERHIGPRILRISRVVEVKPDPDRAKRIQNGATNL